MKILLIVVFLFGIAIGQTGKPKPLSIYGCVTQDNPASNYEGSRQTACIIYDQNMDAHFIVTSIYTPNGAGTSVIQIR